MPKTEAPAAKSTGAGKLTTEEKRTVKGATRMRTYTELLRLMGWAPACLVIFTIGLSILFDTADPWFLANWSALTWDVPLSTYRALYAALVGGMWLAVGSRALLVFFVMVITAAQRVHRAMLGAVLASPIAFYDTTPIGQIINRFTGDLTILDDKLGNTCLFLLIIMGMMLATIATNVLNSPLILAVVPFFAVFYVRLAARFRPANRDITRLTRQSDGPLLSLFNETLSGLVTIRAFGRAAHMESRFRTRVEVCLRCRIAEQGSRGWLTTRLQVISSTVLLCCGLFALLTNVTTNEASGASDGSLANSTSALRAGYAGGAITSAVWTSEMLSALLQLFGFFEMMMLSVERLLDYTRLPAQETPDPVHPPEDWPSQGGIVIEGASLRYRPGLPLVLDQLSLVVPGGQKVGFVGRTGAGKSSILVALLRVAELHAGRIDIDGFDIAHVPLQTLRSRVAIIPQDPTLFKGTLRMNLDRFDEHSDERLWEVLDQCAMARVVRELPSGLAHQVQEKGGNFSVGERQLLCMCRALLKMSRLVMLDEATASVDHATDSTLQGMLHKELVDATVLMIAHRLDTVMTSDRAVVIDAGRVAEDGPPTELLEQEDGHLAHLWKIQNQKKDRPSART